MGLAHSPRIVTNGLILCLDAGNAPKSAKGFKNLLNLSTWTLGTGGVTGFSQNGLTSENQRILDTGPFGVSTVVWDTPSNDATSDADGGWETSTISIDVTKTYRFSTWIRRKTVGDGSSYLGPHSNWGAVAGQYILNRSNSAENQNPYFYAGGWWGNANDWYLVVGHVYAAGSGSGSMHPDSGIYNTSGTKLYNTQADFMWAATNTNTFHRSYLYYSTDTTTNQQWYQPRIDLCDGTEPTIAELIAGVGSKIYDISGNGNNVDILNNAALYNSAGYMNFDGVDDYMSLLTNIFTPSLPNFTISVWFNKNSDGILIGNHYHGSTWESVWFDTGQFMVNGANNSTTNRQILYFTTPSSGTWHNLVAVNNSSSFMKVYLNGKEIASKSSTVIPWNSPIIPTIGLQRNVNGTLASPKFNGNIANIKIYNRVLSAVEIQQNFNALRGRFGL